MSKLIQAQEKQIRELKENKGKLEFQVLELKQKKFDNDFQPKRHEKDSTKNADMLSELNTLID